MIAALLLLGAAPHDRCADLARLASGKLAITAVRDGAMCRVEATARPRPRSAIGVELWLPPPERWSGRYYQMGNGGFAGHIDRATLAAAAARGDVAGATDTGHHGDGFDASWAVGRPDLVRDYAWGSIKIASDTARAVTRAYYGRDARRRYFMGCSYGGRQALVAAGRWPRDWDGVIAGAPAIHWPERWDAFARIQRAIRAPGAWLSAGQLAGVVQTQDRRPLSPAQARGVATIEAEGYPLSGASAAEWQRWFYQPDPTQPSTATFAREGRRFPRQLRPEFRVPNLRTFAAKGGRVLSYFGGADAVLPPALAGADARSVGAREGFYRLFPVPGMAHCQGGDAPHAIGQALAAPALRDDAAHDVRRALEAWVEEGRAPDRLVAVTPGAPSRTALLTPVPLGSP